MATLSAFDVIGPNMVGPSSSHTAGAVGIALIAHKLIEGNIIRVKFTLYGSFAKTYKGHGTDRALLGGILGFETDDLRIARSFEIARERGIDFTFVEDETLTDVHPNTVDIEMESDTGDRAVVRGVSIGGGRVKIVKINGLDVDFTGEYCTLIVHQQDKPGVVAHITTQLSKANVNIAFMRLFRENKGTNAFTIVESDDEIPQDVVKDIKNHKYVHEVTIINI